jgi:hypothetical protein
LQKSKENTPSKYDLKKIATQILVSELRLITGKSRGKLEKHFKKTSEQSDAQFRNLHLRSFCKYADGTRSIGDDDLVEEIERQYPGTTKILDHPLWFILNNPSSNLKAIHKNMQSLNPDVRSIVCVDRKKAGFYPRRKYTDVRFLYRIGMKNDLDALACLLMITREMEILERWDRYIHAKWVIHWLFFRLTDFEPFKIVADKLYKIIYGLFIGTNDPLPLDDFSLNFFYGDLTPPPFVGYRKQIDDKLLDILSNAKNHNLKADDKHSQLKLLFWCCTFGVDRLHDALRSKKTELNSQAFIEKLSSAYNSSSPESHLPINTVLSMWGPFCITESTLSQERHLELLDFV